MRRSEGTGNHVVGPRGTKKEGRAETSNDRGTAPQAERRAQATRQGSARYFASEVPCGAAKKVQAGGPPQLSSGAREGRVNWLSAVFSGVSPADERGPASTPMRVPRRYDRLTSRCTRVPASGQDVACRGQRVSNKPCSMQLSLLSAYRDDERGEEVPSGDSFNTFSAFHGRLSLKSGLL